MKSIVLHALIFISLSFTLTETYKVNTETSSIIWTGRKVTGEHEGTISIKEGKVKVENGKVVGGSLILDMPSIKVTDIENVNSNKKLKDHLHASYFFDVKNHPRGEFVILKLTHKDENNYLIHGELTIKGIQKPLDIPATILVENSKMVVVGETDIDRAQFNLKYDAGSFFDSFGDKAIKDNFGIKFKVLAVK